MFALRLFLLATAALALSSAMALMRPLQWGAAQAQQSMSLCNSARSYMSEGNPPKRLRNPRRQNRSRSNARLFPPRMRRSQRFQEFPTRGLGAIRRRLSLASCRKASGPWLAISGGGSDGAYGGGVLAGWTQSGTRPEFAVVTGSSIGALIAPFAFLGPRYDEEIRKNFTTISAADIFEDRATPDSLFDHWPLRRQVEQRITPALLAEIAAEHARGRRLLVATTNLDAGRRVIWNMGAIAARATKALSSCFARCCSHRPVFLDFFRRSASRSKRTENVFRKCIAMER